MKEKIILFLCDISGTFDESKKEPKDGNMMAELSYLLHEKVRNDKVDKLFFVFLTADEREDFVIKNMKKLKEALASNVIDCNTAIYNDGLIHFLGDEKYISSVKYNQLRKEEKIVKYVFDLKENYDISSIIVADDFANQSWLDSLSFDDIPVKLLIPSHPKIKNESVFTSEYFGMKGLLDCIRKLENKKEDKFWFVDTDDDMKKSNQVIE